MHIQIVSDNVCPWCFIAKRRLERALSARPQIEYKIEWHPFLLNPNTPITGLDRIFYLRAKFGSDEKIAEMQTTVQIAGLKENIPFSFYNISKIPNTILSHRLIHWSQQYDLQNKIVDQIFLSYFRDGMDIGDINTLIDISEASGLDRKETKKYLSSTKNLSEISTKADEARYQGINAVPCFVFNGEYALYGAHEPETLFRIFDLLTN